MEVAVTTGAIRRAELQSNHQQQQTNTQFLQARCHSCRQQCQSTEGKYGTDLWQDIMKSTQRDANTARWL